MHVGVDGVEVVMFNCPQWEISVNHIQASAPSSTSATVSPGNTSCDSLVTVDIPYCTTEAAISLTFNTSNWVHLAEVRFYYNSSTCPFITKTPSSDATAATTIVTTHSYSDTDSPQTTSNHEMTPPSNTTTTTAVVTTHFSSDTDSLQTTSDREMTPQSDATVASTVVTTHSSSDTNALQTATTLDLEATTGSDLRIQK